jgi:hypothetical protein
MAVPADAVKIQAMPYALLITVYLAGQPVVQFGTGQEFQTAEECDSAASAFVFRPALFESALKANVHVLLHCDIATGSWSVRPVPLPSQAR